MALHGLSLGDRQEFSRECLCLSDNKGEAGKRRKGRIVRVRCWTCLGSCAVDRARVPWPLAILQEPEGHSSHAAPWVNPTPCH